MRVKQSSRAAVVYHIAWDHDGKKLFLLRPDDMRSTDAQADAYGWATQAEAEGFAKHRAAYFGDRWDVYRSDEDRKLTFVCGYSLKPGCKPEPLFT